MRLVVAHVGDAGGSPFLGLRLSCAIREGEGLAWGIRKNDLSVGLEIRTHV
jgi:hypothetical protein